MANEVDETELTQMLEHVLTPLEPDVRREVISWAKEHLSTTPIYWYLCAEREPGDSSKEDALEFKIGESSPLDPDNTVFAIFHWADQGTYVVYSFKAAIVAEGEHQGAALGIFTRDIVHKPRFGSGPLTLQALVADLEYHLHETPWPDEPDDEPDVPAAEERPARTGSARR